MPRLKVGDGQEDSEDEGMDASKEKKKNEKLVPFCTFGVGV